MAANAIGIPGHRPNVNPQNVRAEAKPKNGGMVAKAATAGQSVREVHIPNKSGRQETNLSCSPL